jgi:hypothetical protein
MDTIYYTVMKVTEVEVEVEVKVKVKVKRFRVSLQVKP